MNHPELLQAKNEEREEVYWYYTHTSWRGFACFFCDIGRDKREVKKDRELDGMVICMCVGKTTREKAQFSVCLHV